jgi:hypothetical protein
MAIVMVVMMMMVTAIATMNDEGDSNWDGAVGG